MSYSADDYIYDSPDYFSVPPGQQDPGMLEGVRTNIKANKTMWAIGTVATGFLAGAAITHVFRDTVDSMLDSVKKGVGMATDGTKEVVDSAASLIAYSKRRRQRRARKH